MRTLLVTYLLALATACLAISFRLEPEVRKCVKEEVHKDVLVVGEYRLSNAEGQKTDLVVSLLALPLKRVFLNNPHPQVADSKGHTLFRKEAATKGRFAFTTEDYDMFEVCFYSVVLGQFVCVWQMCLQQAAVVIQIFHWEMQRGMFTWT